MLHQNENILDYTVNKYAVSIGSSNLYQSYYVCLTESTTSTVIEYGKTYGTTEKSYNYLTITDRSDPVKARFYTFGNGEADVQVMDVQVIPRSGITQTCMGATTLDAAGHFCVAKPCHEYCDEVEGMFSNIKEI